MHVYLPTYNNIYTHYTRKYTNNINNARTGLRIRHLPSLVDEESLQVIF